ncbi:uncharacterized protein FIBRA_00923 [Fibroporia radiculosa]|uniref:TPX2 C-terminal domain-containing protein n=1 Tax=Fibroporia radiculosa TaxID=599839 RepID=J4I874_9APHY|nr:uncharacterized protein FIBRA_00923 [Fibroporia radiculosa]CCL98916.1 predicted protein [Fibroporia radiculosa]
MGPDLSLRHIPDASDASLSFNATPDFSDSSFQIPLAGSSNTFLLDDDSLDFLRSAPDTTLSTPAPLQPHRRLRSRSRSPTKHSPSKRVHNTGLTLTELTPRAPTYVNARTPRSAAVRSSLRPHLRMDARAEVATPRRAAIAADISTALTDTLSPFAAGGGGEPSFQIPTSTLGGGGFLLHDDDADDMFRELEETLSARHHVAGAGDDSDGALGCLKEQGQEPAASPSSRSSRLPSPTRSGNVEQNLLREDTQGRQDADDQAELSECDAVDSGNVIPCGQGDPGNPEDDTSLAAEPGSNVAHQTNVQTVRGVACRTGRTTSRGLSAKTLSTRRKPVVIGGGISKPGKARLRPVVARAVLDSSSAKRGGGTLQGGPRRLGIADSMRLTKARLGSTKAKEPDRAEPGPGALVSALLSYGHQIDQGRASLGPTDPETNRADAGHPPNGSTPGTDGEAEPGVGDMSAGEEGELDRDSPLTVSQLSPTKRGEGRTPTERVSLGGTRPASPGRSSVKRTRSPAPDSCPENAHKRSRTAPPAPASALALGTLVDKAAARPRRGLAAAFRRQRSADLGRKVGEGGASNCRSSGEQGSSSSEPPPHLTHTRPPPADKENDPHQKPMSRPADPPGFGKQFRDICPLIDMFISLTASAFQPPALPPAKPTRPIEFHFLSDARAEARRAERDLATSGGSSSTSASTSAVAHGHASVSIPDFKAMHAAQESALQARRGQIVPVTAVDFELATDARAREREEYDRARRAREEELARQMEERRRLQAVEEEREVRELRRRAVPRAHEVPEWYARAPKRAAKTRPAGAGRDSAAGDGTDKHRAEIAGHASRARSAVPDDSAPRGRRVRDAAGAGGSAGADAVGGGNGRRGACPAGQPRASDRTAATLLEDEDEDEGEGERGRACVRGASSSHGMSVNPERLQQPLPARSQQVRAAPSARNTLGADVGAAIRRGEGGPPPPDRLDDPASGPARAAQPSRIGQRILLARPSTRAPAWPSAAGPGECGAARGDGEGVPCTAHITHHASLSPQVSRLRAASTPPDRAAREMGSRRGEEDGWTGVMDARGRVIRAVLLARARRARLADGLCGANQEQRRRRRQQRGLARGVQRLGPDSWLDGVRARASVGVRGWGGSMRRARQTSGRADEPPEAQVQYVHGRKERVARRRGAAGVSQSAGVGPARASGLRRRWVVGPGWMRWRGGRRRGGAFSPGQFDPDLEGRAGTQRRRGRAIPQLPLGADTSPRPPARHSTPSLDPGPAHAAIAALCPLSPYLPITLTLTAHADALHWPRPRQPTPVIDAHTDAASSFLSESPPSPGRCLPASGLWARGATRTRASEPRLYVLGLLRPRPGPTEARQPLATATQYVRRAAARIPGPGGAPAPALAPAPSAAAAAAPAPGPGPCREVPARELESPRAHPPGRTARRSAEPSAI